MQNEILPVIFVVHTGLLHRLWESLPLLPWSSPPLVDIGAKWRKEACGATQLPVVHAALAQRDWV